MKIEIKPYTIERIGDVVLFEKALRREEDGWGWEIDEAYLEQVKRSFLDDSFRDSISLLAYAGSDVVGRIDASMIKSHFDGSTKAYLDWICVVKSHRHNGVAQLLLEGLRNRLKARGIETLIALTAANELAEGFEINKILKQRLDHDVGKVDLFFRLTRLRRRLVLNGKALGGDLLLCAFGLHRRD